MCNSYALDSAENGVAPLVPVALKNVPAFQSLLASLNFR
jgi:hypothetical protein